MHVGQQVKVRGLAMDGTRTIELVRVVRILKNPKESVAHDGTLTVQDCVTEDLDGMQMISQSSNFIGE